jgi:hypothetical protein
VALPSGITRLELQELADRTLGQTFSPAVLAALREGHRRLATHRKQGKNITGT